MSAWFVTVTVFASVWFLTWLFNCTPFLYFPPKTYKLPGASEMEKPEYGPIDMPNPDSDEAVVFLPGFKAVPMQFEFLINKFRGRYNVCSVLYPGSSVSLEDLAGSRYSQWYAASRDKYLEYRKKYEKVYIVGYSMGGTIGLSLAAEFADDPALKPDGMAGISVLAFNNYILGAGVYYDWRLYFTRFFSWIMRGIKKAPDKDRAVPPGPAFNDDAHIFAVIYSLMMGCREMRRQLKKVDIPLLLMHAKKDEHVPYENMAYVAKNVSSKIIKTHTINMDAPEFDRYTRHFPHIYPETREEVYMETERFIQSIQA